MQPRFLLPLLAALTACGGGSGDAGTDTPSRASIQSAGANSAVLPNDGTEAAAVVLATTRAVVGAGAPTVTVTCPGGGQARYSVTGSNNPLEWLNGQLDAGEVYSISFTACRSDAGAPPIDGALELRVASATSATLTVVTTSRDLRIPLPLRTLTFNGGSTFTQTTTASGNTTTTRTRWTSQAVQVRSQRSGATPALFNLSGVDYERTIGAVNGVPVNPTSQGSGSIQTDLALFTWFITLATLGPVIYDTTGILVTGSWQIDLPDDRITFSVNAQRVSFAFDLGKNGTIDLAFTIDLDAFLADAA